MSTTSKGTHSLTETGSHTQLQSGKLKWRLNGMEQHYVWVLVRLQNITFVWESEWKMCVAHCVQTKQSCGTPVLTERLEEQWRPIIICESTVGWRESIKSLRTSPPRHFMIFAVWATGKHVITDCLRTTLVDVLQEVWTVHSFIMNSSVNSSSWNSTWTTCFPCIHITECVDIRNLYEAAGQRAVNNPSHG